MYTYANIWAARCQIDGEVPYPRRTASSSVAGESSWPRPTRAAGPPDYEAAGAAEPDGAGVTGGSVGGRVG